MTTIAYRAGVIAADRQLTSGTMRVGYTCKIAQGPKGHMGGVAGHFDGIVVFLEWIKNGCKGDPQPVDHPMSGFVVFPDTRLYLWQGSAKIAEFRAEFCAEGTGFEIAMGAMSMGAGAVLAVEKAVEFDTSSGGGIDVLYLRKGKRRTRKGER